MPHTNPSLLPDQPARDRFRTELKSNFSVLAPAGVGKTSSIVSRVVAASDLEDARSYFSRLAVVTYTNKAADEMQQRARNALIEKAGGAERIGDFNRAFFGTIHSFCLNLLRLHGHYLGLPGRLDMAGDQAQDDLWNSFFRQFSIAKTDSGLTPTQLRTCLRHVAVQDVLSMARDMPVRSCRPRSLGDFPVPDFGAVADYQPANSRSRKSVEEAKAIMSQWRKAFESDAPFLPLPEYSKGGEDFQSAWADSLRQSRSWLSRATLALSSAIAREYEQFRIACGTLTYADQIRFVLELLMHPHAGKSLRGTQYIILLDEAQDTDPDQFRVLLELSRPADATGLWISSGGPPPRPGAFCMVGDPQQSIYSARADLGFYQEVRKKLVSDAGAQELAFHVTFRCDTGIVNAANALCPNMLNGKDGQVGYVTLNPRPGATAGQAARLVIRTPENDNSSTGVDALMVHEAAAIAQWLKKAGPGALGASAWSQVAVLCARKRWIDPIESELAAAGVPVQNQSRREVHGDLPAFAWLTALVTIMADPSNHFEIVGVLREVFGIPDTELYAFCRGDGRFFQIENPTDGKGIVAGTLNLLHDTRDSIAQLPLTDAVETIAANTRLRARLEAIHEEDDASRTAVLDNILSRAADDEAEGMSLRQWADELRNSFEDTAPAPSGIADSVQLITCHAAKGLEWDAVIIPGFFRPIRTMGTSYPAIREDRRSNALQAVLAPDWIPELKTQAEISQKQELQRLLYVALTRARRSLVIVDDSALFPKPASSFAACLGFADSVRPAAWDAIPSTIRPSVETVRRAGKTLTGEPPMPARLTTARVGSALRHASKFPHRTLPHTLARHHFDAEPERRLSNDPEWNAPAGDFAVRYGVWWHETMEGMPWKEPARWREHFDKCTATCPDVPRAEKEWTLFAKSDLASRLADTNVAVRTEIPILHKIADSECVEGFIDLVFRGPPPDEWFVVDWKTNVIARDQLGELRDIYELQLKAYARAVSCFTGKTSRVRSAVYSTPHGILVDIPTSSTR